MSSDSSNVSLQEWQETRDVLKRFDENHHDLRKYGFVFLAALLTADSVQAYLGLPIFTRFVLLIITITFIVGLRLLDHNYHNFKEAASIRSRILEASLNIELSETIGVHYVNENWGKYIDYVYDAFMFITFLLGVAILFPKDSSLSWTFLGSNEFIIFVIYIALLSVATVVGILFMKNFSKNVCINYARQDYDIRDFNDWTIEKLSCKKGERVKISVTNLHPKINPKKKAEESEEQIFHAGEVAFRIIDEDDKEIWAEKVTKEIVLMNFGTYSWLWDTSNQSVKPNRIYRVWPRFRKSPLSRSIVVYEK